MPATDPQLRLLARAYQDRQVAVAQRCSSIVGGLWDELGALDDAARFATAAADIVTASIEVSISLADSYVAEYVSAATDTTTGATGGTDIEYRGGLDPVDVYQRPTRTARIAISTGRTFLEAMAAGRARAVQTADTDPMLAARAAANAAMARIDRVVGYRRVPDGGACLLCTVASTQRYHVGQLMPIHSSCHCTTAPIVGNRDPGRIVDRATYDRLKTAGTPQTREHPELGPILTGLA